MNLLKAFAALKQLRFFSLIISFSLAMPLVAISAVQGVQAAESDLVVYSSRKEHLLKPLTDAYTKLTGVKITLYTGKEGALIERLKAEGAETQADVLMLADAGNLGYAAQEGLFQPLNSPLIEKNIPANLRDGGGLWTALSIRARTLIYNTNKLIPSDLKGYADLADPKWKNELCLRTSKKVYNKSLVASLIAHHGEEKAEQIVKGWVNNLAMKPQAKDSQVMQAIIGGGCDVGIVNSYYFGGLVKQQPDVPLKLFWPDQDTTGTHINVSGAGVIKHADQVQKAKQFIEWLSDGQAQEIYAEWNNEYPANPTIKPSELVASWGEFKADSLSLNEVVKYQQQAVKLMQRVGYR
ncbi:putative binding protein component of ABC iron transporter PA5217 [uncultured Thiomicrorhabdus sp.]|jgi:iron(III) transport system substrate-binding protein